MARRIKNNGCLVVFGMVFMLAGCLPIQHLVTAQSQAAENWHETDCTIEALEFHKTPTDLMATPAPPQRQRKLPFCR